MLRVAGTFRSFRRHWGTIFVACFSSFLFFFLSFFFSSSLQRESFFFLSPSQHLQAMKNIALVCHFLLQLNIVSIGRILYVFNEFCGFFPKGAVELHLLLVCLCCCCQYGSRHIDDYYMNIDSITIGLHTLSHHIRLQSVDFFFSPILNMLPIT